MQVVKGSKHKASRALQQQNHGPRQGASRAEKTRYRDMTGTASKGLITRLKIGKALR
jgi:hypothetical protein